MNDEDFTRLRAKLRDFPPYDWEEDVGMLMNELDRYHQELAFIQIQHRNTLRMWPQFHQLDIALDALMRIAAHAAPLEDQTIAQIVRAAQVKIQGER